MAWHRLGIADLHTAYANGETRPTVVAEHMFARIEALNPRLNAFLDLDRKAAIQAAAQSDARFSGGTPRALEGVFIGIKSNIAVAGLELNAGMAARRGMIASHDAEVVRRLRDAGAIIAGTLNMHEAALGATTDNPFFGRAFNPHGEGRTPGGSSGGSGAAVAAGLCIAALGSDTLGSIRIPAAYNGVYGLLPTHDAVSEDGVFPMSHRFDSVGPLARSLDDLATVARVLGLKVDGGTAPSSTATLADLGGVQLEPAVAAAWSRALAVMPTSAFTIAEPLTRIRLAGFVIATRDLTRNLADLPRAKFSDWLNFLIDYAAKRTPDDYAQDLAIVSAMAQQLRAVTEARGAILLPTAPHAAFVQGSDVPHSQADFTNLANLAGLPAISIPAGRNEDGMPVAIQLIGRAGGEAALFALARKFDDALVGYAPPPLF